jgi:hydrogenase expression/formation protein HypD
VTSEQLIDSAIRLAGEGVVLCSFGDMLRVPGSKEDLLTARSEGCDVRVVYSPLDAVRIAQNIPDREVVFFGVGFETTAPATALAVKQASQLRVQNFSMLCSHVLVPPAIESILQSPVNRVQGFLAAGHVCAVMGWHEYLPIAERYRVPIVVTGFEPLDLMHGVLMCIEQLEEGRTEVENQYTRVVRESGNEKAQELLHEIFEVIPQRWRGIGEIGDSGLGIRKEYREFDALKRFSLECCDEEPNTQCISGQILIGEKKPPECPAFGGECTPEHPLGATMVSSEGACAAYYQFRTRTAEKVGGER